MGLFQRIECSLFYHVKSSYRYIPSCDPSIKHHFREIAAGQANLQLAASMQPTSQPPRWESYLQRLLGKFSDQKCAMSGSDVEPKPTLNSDRISSPKCWSFRMLSPSPEFCAKLPAKWPSHTSSTKSESSHLGTHHLSIWLSAAFLLKTQHLHSHNNRDAQNDLILAPL